MFYPSGIFRMKARAVLKDHWQTALLIALIVNLPTLLMQGFSAFTGNDLIPRLNSVLVSASRDGLLPQEQLLKEIDVILGSTSFWTMRGLELLARLITPCLTLGMYRWLLNRVRGLEDPVSTVLCRMNQFFRAIGLHLQVCLDHIDFAAVWQIFQPQKIRIFYQIFALDLHRLRFAQKSRYLGNNSAQFIFE